MEEEKFHDKLKKKMDEYVHLVYVLTKKFPKEEIYGVTSQLRRSSLSVILNYIEGYTRSSDKANKNFLEISYGSLKESKYLIFFTHREGFVSDEDYGQALGLSEEIGVMLWGTIKKIQ